MLKSYEANKIKLQNILDTLNLDGVVQMCTAYKTTEFRKKHINHFKLGKDGSLLVARGKNWDDASFTTFKHYRPKV